MLAPRLRANRRGVRVEALACGIAITLWFSHQDEPTHTLFYLRKPTEETVRQFLLTQRELPFSYADVGATLNESRPEGYVVDHNRIQLGMGELTYRNAVSALRKWKQFDLGWVKIVPEGAPVEVDTVVAVKARTLGLWSLNACRIIYLVDKTGDFLAQFGFAYGTLPAHAESGEERFTIEWRSDDSVWYDIYALSRPQHPLVRLAHPYARHLQKLFAKDSMAAMLGASKPT